MNKTMVLLLAGILSSPVFAQPAACQDLDSRLNALASADQQVRQEGEMLEQDPRSTQVEKDALRQRWREVDLSNLKNLKAILADCGWPAGKKGSHSAWLLAQHADSDIPFQRRAMSLLEEAVKRRAAEPRDLAYLADRIASN
jgi:hypothetical protein